jgi:O-acetyl-ADP-ribose deacetylase (regulator of RNase III)
MFQCDVIVVCWSSKYLLEMIYARGGPSIRSAVNNQIEKKLKNSLTSVKSDGDIKSKRIYFMYWETQTQTDIIQQSLQNLINISMQKAHDDNYRSIAFPAIGCGHYEQSIQLVAQTMVNKAHQEQILHKISVAFIIQPNKKDLFQHFQKQIDILNQSTSMDFVSSTIQNGLIQIEKGNITEQKVSSREIIFICFD